ncbi:MAG: DUF1599 domain-containing protein [Bacteroidales bacterium]|nr:DUF1599 domain-containing protein [Bacteroidales bacterium]
MQNTLDEFDAAVSVCRDLFLKKMDDYGLSWRVLRPTSITDQIYIKAQRIRSIEEKGTRQVADDIVTEYIGIVNYAVMAQIQLAVGSSPLESDTLTPDAVRALYEKYVGNAKDLLKNKNHDYDEAWRNMRVSSFVDIILMKLMRVKQIENHHGSTSVSEGLDANYYDIFNYAVFALIKLTQSQHE